MVDSWSKNFTTNNSWYNSPMQNEHEKFMKAALKEAQKAYEAKECPIGCVIVKDGKVFARAHNLRLTHGNALDHAEIIAIDKACRKLGAVCSCNDIFNVAHGHNHQVLFEGGVLEEECSDLMKKFFKEMRTRNKLSD